MTTTKATTTLRLVAMLTIFASHHTGASLDRNNAFIGYSESSGDDGGVGRGGGGGGGGGENEGGGGCQPQDDNEGCRAWAHAGECDKNPGFMRVSCAFS